MYNSTAKESVAKSVVDTWRRQPSGGDGSGGGGGSSILSSGAGGSGGGGGGGSSGHHGTDAPKEHPTFKVVVDGDDGGVLMRQVYSRIATCIEVRAKYRGPHAVPTSALMSRVSPKATISSHGGIYSVSDHQAGVFYNMHPWSVFAADAEQVRLTFGNSLCAKAAAHRLSIIQERSRTFFLLNTDIEEPPNHRRGGGVLSAVNRVDNSVKLSRALCAQELLEMVLDTYNRFPEEIVGRNAERPQESLTLRELFDGHGISDPGVLTVEALGWHPAPRQRTRSAASNPLYPLSIALRRTFLNPEGAFAPRILKRLLGRNEIPKANHATEMRLSLYGANKNELLDIANFLRRNEIGPYRRNMWVLQLRFYDNPPEGVAHDVKTVQDQLDTLFLPLLHATVNGEDTRYASIAWLLPQIGAIQIESTNMDPVADFDKRAPPPPSMAAKPPPNRLYYAYYVHASLLVLNSLRLRRGMNTIQLRIGGGSSSDLDTAIAGYMFADVVTQAAGLMHLPVAQYAFGMHRIGITVAPLHDNGNPLTPYANHPLATLLHRCMNVAISTESPMNFHHDFNALREEYGTAQKMFHFSALDMTELARNSVVMSSFPGLTKTEWIGDGHAKGVIGNDFRRCEVTSMRLDFREGAWLNEREMLDDLLRANAKPTVLTTSSSMYASRRRSLAPSSQQPARAAAESAARWHFLSTVTDVEYFAVLDARIRYPRTVISGPHKADRTAQQAAPLITKALQMRSRYAWQKPEPWRQQVGGGPLEADFQRTTNTFSEDEWTYETRDAVFVAYHRNETHEWPRGLPTVEDFSADLQTMQSISANIVVKEFAHRRLELLDHKFSLHLALNHANEAGTTEHQASTNRDIYQAYKVDTHIHMAAGMTPRQLLQFLLRKMNDSPDDIVVHRGGTVKTLNSLMRSSGINHKLTVDQLSVQADHTLFERFDNFNNKYNPMDNRDLRTLLLKTDNDMNGRYFAEIVHRCFEEYSRDSRVYAENRLSIYGINLKEWEKLAAWSDTHGMSSKHNKWIVQVPRVYKVFRKMNTIGSFGQYLDNIFRPLWEASLHPAQHPAIHNFLKHVSGFDSVDNEATLDLPFSTMTPWEWTSLDNPPYNYYLYYLYANIRTLNEFRARRGFNTFDLRPHCGESGADEHLHGAFLVADGIGHGINLKNDPSMEYLYYLAQIGLHVSPLSNNALFVRFLSNPFPVLFRRGLNVSLSTDDPLMFHQTEEPLIEEYSVASRVWGLSPNDLCEIARNSVRQCGFDHEFKRRAIGDRWFLSSSLGNDSHRTHLSDIRVAYRFETYHTEVSFLESVAEVGIHRAMLTARQEQDIEVGQSTLPEEVLLSTHDQGMEVALRGIEATRDEMRTTKARVEVLRRQQRTLVASLTELASRQQAEAQEAARKRPPLVYVRQGANGLGGVGGAGANLDGAIARDGHHRPVASAPVRRRLLAGGASGGAETSVGGSGNAYTATTTSLFPLTPARPLPANDANDDGTRPPLR